MLSHGMIRLSSRTLVVIDTDSAVIEYIYQGLSNLCKPSYIYLFTLVRTHEYRFCISVKSVTYFL